jgi:hypothetical protein
VPVRDALLMGTQECHIAPSVLDTETADCGHLRYRPPVRASGGGREHAALAARVRQALAVLWNTGGRSGAAGDPLMLERARKLANYFGQPFFVAEPYTWAGAGPVGACSEWGNPNGCYPNPSGDGSAKDKTFAQLCHFPNI